MRLIEEILADINKAKAKVTSVELEIGHTTGVSSQINRLIQAQNLLTYCHSRLSDIDPASLRAKGEWLSVEDRLPQEGGAVCENVILFMDNGLVTVGWLNQITNRGYYLDTINDVVIKAPLSRFTHWMPLPEPPNCGADMREGHP